MKQTTYYSGYDPKIEKLFSEKGGRSGSKSKANRSRRGKYSQVEYTKKISFKPVVDEPKVLTKAYSKLGKELKKIGDFYDWLSFLDDILWEEYLRSVYVEGVRREEEVEMCRRLEEGE